MGGIFLDATTRFYLNMLRSAQAVMGKAQRTEQDGSFRQAVEKAAASAAGVSAVDGGVKIFSTADMTMDEYKRYIYEQILRMPVNRSQMQDAVSVSISEEGFAAMKEDPEYEKWVLDTLRRDLAAYYPWGTMGESTYRSHHFGATKDDYRGYCFAKDNRSRRLAEQQREKAAEAEKRRKKHKEYLMLCEKLWLKREREQDYLDVTVLCDRARHRRETGTGCKSVCAVQGGDRICAEFYLFQDPVRRFRAQKLIEEIHIGGSIRDRTGVSFPKCSVSHHSYESGL